MVKLDKVTRPKYNRDGPMDIIGNVLVEVVKVYDTPIVRGEMTVGQRVDAMIKTYTDEGSIARKITVHLDEERD